jgi:hypothetical protein
MLAPALFANQHPSIVRIEATRPAFLVFGTEWRRPACVAQIGPREPLERLHAALTILHARVPDLVPASLACVPWGERDYLFLQQGLAGVPWFRLLDEFGATSDLISFQARAICALEQLHSAITMSPEWRCRLMLSDGLLGQIEQASSRDSTWAPHLVRALHHQAEALRPLGEIEWFWQHGDFCVNNLLIAPDAIGIVDFEEFGATSVPLHDQISLALSLEEVAESGQNWKNTARYVRACAEATLISHPELSTVLAGLVVYHLVWRINQCDARPRRVAIRTRLVTLLTTFVECGADAYFA